MWTQIVDLPINVRCVPLTYFTYSTSKEETQLKLAVADRTKPEVEI